MLKLLILSALLLTNQSPAEDPSAARMALARAQIRDLKYQDAMVTLEALLEKRPNDPEALTLMGAANMYSTRDFVKSLTWFTESYAAGGGAVFWVSHSHEKLGTSDLADYCRGWLYLRKGEVEFAPENTQHGFRLPYSAVKGFGQNKLLRNMFHITDSTKTYNFRSRTGEQSETILVIALYKKFSRAAP